MCPLTHLFDPSSPCLSLYKPQKAPRYASKEIQEEEADGVCDSNPIAKPKNPGESE